MSPVKLMVPAGVGGEGQEILGGCGCLWQRMVSKKLRVAAEMGEAGQLQGLTDGVDMVVHV
jgi:hypothetical protein